MEHLFKLRILVRRKHGLIGIVAFGHQCLHLLHFFLGQEVVIFVDGLRLAAQVFLAALQLCDLVVGEVEPQLQSFHIRHLAHLPVFGHAFTLGRLLVFLLLGQQGGELVLLIFLKGHQTGLVLFKRDIVLFEEIGCFLAIVLIDCHHLLTLLGRIVNCPAVPTCVRVAEPVSSVETVPPAEGATAAESVLAVPVKMTRQTIAAGSFVPAAMHTITMMGTIGTVPAGGGRLGMRARRQAQEEGSYKDTDLYEEG